MEGKTERESRVLDKVIGDLEQISEKISIACEDSLNAMKRTVSPHPEVPTTGINEKEPCMVADDTYQGRIERCINRLQISCAGIKQAVDKI